MMLRTGYLMPKVRNDTEQGSEMSLVPALVVLLLVMCLYLLDVSILELVVSAIERVVPPTMSP